MEASSRASSVLFHSDKTLASVADIPADWRVAQVARRGTPLFAANGEGREAMETAGLAVAGHALVADAINAGELG